jgi:hypothetical protein
MFQGLADLGTAWLSFMNPMTLLYGLGGAFVGIVMGIRRLGHARYRAADHATIKLPATTILV